MKKHHLFWFLALASLAWFASQACFPVAPLPGPPSNTTVPIPSCTDAQGNPIDCAVSPCKDNYGYPALCPNPG